MTYKNPELIKISAAELLRIQKYFNNSIPKWYILYAMEILNTNERKPVYAFLNQHIELGNVEASKLGLIAQIKQKEYDSSPITDLYADEFNLGIGADNQEHIDNSEGDED